MIGFSYSWTFTPSKAERQNGITTTQMPLGTGLYGGMIVQLRKNPL
jgi:hypothetical protein